MPLPPLTREQAEITTRMAELARTRFAPRAARHDAESFPSFAAPGTTSASSFCAADVIV